MTLLLFPDNTALINFALIHRMDLLEQIVGDQGQWCYAVSEECRRSSRLPELADLAGAPAIFGSPLIPSQAETVDAYVIRNDLAAPGEPRSKHLGEAETVAIVSRRQLRAVFITDDTEAQRIARENGINFSTTWTLLRVALNRGFIDQSTLWGYLRTLRQHGRGHPPGVRDWNTFLGWV